MSLRLTKKRKVAFEQNEQHTEDLGNTRPVKKSVIGKLKAGRTKPISDKLAEVADKEEASTSSSTFTIVAGSYEKLLYGLEGSLEGEEINIKPVFIFPAHISCVRALGASPHGGRWLATGSTDEIIKVWDLRRRKEVGGLVQHEGLS
jgi:protein MAK11